MKSRPMADSFYYAGRGMIYALVSQRNMKIHSLAAIIVIAAGFFFQVSSLEWVMLILTIGLVMTLEIINTAIECAVDLVTKERQPLARKAKDAAAGAVLLAAGLSVIIGLIIFVPRIMALIRI